MIYIIGFIVGLLNGLFTAGAGQILVFYFLYILKIEAHLSRSISVAILSVSSLIAIFGYSKFIDFEIKQVFLIIVISIITGIIGSKLMKKIESNILNLLSGGIIVVLTLIQFFVKR